MNIPTDKIEVVQMSDGSFKSVYDFYEEELNANEIAKLKAYLDRAE